MFCPKCGSQVPDDVKFCGNCGNKFENVSVTPKTSAASVVGNSSPIGSSVASSVSSATSALKTTPIGIVAAILAVVALIFSFMPWFELSAAMNTVSGAASGLAGLFGASSGSYAFDETYTVWGLVGLADTFSDYASALSSFGSSKAAGASVLVSIFAWLCLILWIVSLVLSVIGVISTFAKGSMGTLRAGSIFMVITVLFFYFFAGQMGSDTGSATTMPMMCLVVSAAALVCSFFASNAQG